GDQPRQVVKHLDVFQRSADRVELAKVPANMLTPQSEMPPERLITRTVWPPAASFSTVGRPMKPVPPVTRMRIGLAPSLHAVAHAATLGGRTLAMPRDIDPLHAALQGEDPSLAKRL